MGTTPSKPAEQSSERTPNPRLVTPPAVTASASVPTSPQLIPNVSFAAAEQAALPSASAYEAYERRVDEQLRGIDFDVLSQLVEQSRRGVEAAKGRDLILLVGSTGAGKSTLLNYLMGARMQVIEDSETLQERLVVAEGEKVYAEIGNQTDESKTLHPQIIPMLESPDDLAYCDCPGFADTRTREMGLCASIGVPMAILSARAIRAMVVVIDYQDLTAVRGQGFSALAKTLGRLLKNPENIPNNILFVFTKVSHPKIEATHIRASIVKKKESLTKKIDDLQSEFKENLKRLSESLGIPPALKNPESEEERREVLRKIETTIAASKEGIARKVQDISDRLERIKEELDESEIQLSIYNAILAAPENLYVMRGGDEVCKLKMVADLKRLASNIPGDQFLLDGSRGGNWDLLDKIVQRISGEGALLLSMQKSYPEELFTLKKYKKLIEGQRTRQVELLRNLTSGTNFTEAQLAAIREEILNMNRGVIDHANKTLEERRAEKARLEKELLALDTDEPTRYHHRSLEPVEVVSTSPVMLPGVLMALPLSPIGLSTGVIVGGVVTGIAILLQMSGLNISTRLIDIIVQNPQIPLSFLVTSAAVRIFSATYHFKYNDLPFVVVNNKSSLDLDSNGIYSANHDANDDDKYIIFEGFVNVNEVKHDLRKALLPEFGFIRESEIKDFSAGKYEITFRPELSSSDKEEKLTVWIELFVQKRIHPDYKPRIDILKGRIRQLEFSSKEYLAFDQTQLTSSLQYELNYLNNGKEGLIKILAERLKSYERRMEILRGCILGYRIQVRSTAEALARQKPHYDMLKRLIGVIGTRDDQFKFVKEFLADYDTYFNQPSNLLLTPVWGTKKTPEVQPEYVAEQGVVEGQAIKALFRVQNKISSSRWFGKLGYSGLPPLFTSELTPYSKVRRGSSLESVLEKIGADLYTYLSNDHYLVPNTRLAELPIKNQITTHHLLTEELWKEINHGRNPKIDDGIYVMSKRVEDYKNLADLADCILDGKLLKFLECLNQGRIPERVMVEEKNVPLVGVIEILAAARLLADTDVLGGGAMNAGFLIERDARGQPSVVRAVKIDPGYAFNFSGPQNLLYESYHPAVRDDHPLKLDKRHLQFGNMAKPLLWDNLTGTQQTQFILALKFGLTKLENADVLLKIFSGRDFTKTPKHQLELPDVTIYFSLLLKNIKLQSEVYKEELDQLKATSLYR